MIRVLLSLLSVSVALVSHAYGQERIPIGVLLPLTGNLGSSGQSIWEGIRIAHKMFPRVLDRQVALRVADTRSEKAEAANAVFRLLEKEEVVALIGEMPFVRSVADSRCAGRRSVPTVTTAATSPSGAQGECCVFGVSFTGTDQAIFAVKLALDHLHARTAAIVYDMAQEDSIRLAARFKSEFARAGGEILCEMRLRTGDRDYTAQINQIRKTRPEIIYAPVYHTECALIAREARCAGLNTPIVAGNWVHTPELVELGREFVEDILFTSHVHEDMIRSEMGEKFRRMCEIETGREPQESHFRGAEAYFLILNAIRRCGSIEPARIGKALSCASDYNSMVGTIKINNDVTTRSPVYVNQVKYGKFVHVPIRNLWPQAKNTLMTGEGRP
jgi:branched-chain amino acid transport system substrate-binding protein